MEAVNIAVQALIDQLASYTETVPLKNRKEFGDSWFQIGESILGIVGGHVDLDIA